MRSAPTGAIVASVYRHYHWDIYVLDTQGELLKRLTFGEGDNRAPDWSPDGARIAFESNRDGNWSIYSANADGSGARRLTTELRFEGSPRWSPDGRRIAYTAEKDGDLDVWVMDVDGSHAVDLTPKSQAHDYDPVWSPDGAQIAFTSIRDGNKEIYLMNADGSGVRNLTQEKSADQEHPAWSPDGKRVAFVSERNGAREIDVVEVAAPQAWRRVTALDYNQWPAWSPDGSALAYVWQSETEQSLWLAAADGSRAAPLTHDTYWYRQPDWNGQAGVARDPASLAREDQPLFTETVMVNPPGSADPFNFVKLPNMRMTLPASLSDRVDDSFMAWRQRVNQVSGWDFLNNLSESYRPLSFKSSASDYLSWHKVGRAVDLLWDYLGPTGRNMEIAREDLLGETYWRVYLRTAKQDGSLGEPLRQAVWDVSPQARARAANRGGLIRGVLPGYYIDVTELARQFGWRRIPSHTQPDFDWRRDFQALEYWHYQASSDVTWWEALREVYPPSDYKELFSYESLVRQRYDTLTMNEKGIPLPPDVTQRFSQMVP